MEKTKQRLLRVLDIIKRTDEQHPITANEIVAELERYGIEAERKAVLRDIEALSDYGYQIVTHADNKLGWYMIERDFEDWELKVLCDAVAGAQFLTKTDSKRLIDKLCNLSGENGKKLLRSVTPIESVSKNPTASTKIYIDTILKAIKSKKQVNFQYVYTDADMKKVLKYDGIYYRVNPYSLYWNNDKYYLVGNYSGYDNLSHYRLDRIRNLSVSEEDILSADKLLGANASLQIAEHVKKAFYNYSGEKICLTLRFNSYMADDLIDRFGQDIKLTKSGDMYEMTVVTEESNGLYYWLLQYGEEVTVVSPERVREEVLRRVESIRKNYEEGNNRWIK